MKYFCLLSCLLLTLFYTSCSEDCDTPTMIPINSQSGYLPPYTGFDTLRFLHNNIDTQIYIGQGASEYSILKPATNDMECPKKYVGAKYLFKLSNGGNIIEFTYCPFDEPYTYKFYYNGIYAGSNKTPSGLDYIDKLQLNNNTYKKLAYNSISSDTNSYFLLSFDIYSKDVIVKIQYPGDTLTLIK